MLRRNIVDMMYSIFICMTLQYAECYVTSVGLSRSEEKIGAIYQQLARKTRFAGDPRWVDAAGRPARVFFRLAGRPPPT